MTVVMLTAALLFFVAGERLVRSIVGLMQSGLGVDSSRVRDEWAVVTSFQSAIVAALDALLPVLLLLPVAAVLGGIAIGGFSFSTEALRPKLSKLNPLAGLKRMFGVHGLMELVKAIAKASVVGACAIGVLFALGPRIFSLGRAAVPDALGATGGMLVTTLLVCSASLGLIALVDVPFQIWNHNKRLRMTRKEVYDELKETEGRPEVKGRIRQLQREIANRRMLEAVPAADVIVTNPTHYSVALKYDDAHMRAPVVVAKGVDHMALRIRELAAKHEVPLFEAPLLARSLYATSEIDEEIDPRLYRAVAQVLTYIFQLRKVRSSVPATPWPYKPEIELTEELTRRGDS